MSNARKILAKMRRNPRDWRIEDLKSVAQIVNVSFVYHGTSHVVFRHEVASRLSVPAHKPIKLLYVKMFVEFIAKTEESNEDQ